MAGLGLYHVGARWVDPSLGRWLSADTLVPEPANPQGLNRYSFVLGNPLRYVDPSGHEGLPPDTEELVQTYAEIYEIPWQVLAGLLQSEIELDTDLKDAFETWFMRLAPLAAWSGNTTARAALDIALWWKPNPGPGIGNVHVETARFVSEYFAIHYGDDATVQLHLHDKSTEQVGFLLSLDSVNVKVVGAYARLLADFRFGANGTPSQTGHASLSDWTTTDAVAVWHGYRYGVEGSGPRGQGEGFDLADFQKRNLNLDMTVDLAIGQGKSDSMYGSLPYFEYYFGQ